jgi:mgtE-like transporter
MAFNGGNLAMTNAVNFRTFSKTFKESLIAYSFDIGGLFAGFIVASQLNVFQLFPWTIALYPAVLSARGFIGGLFSGRLGTALHVGTIYPRFFKNTKSFYMLFEAVAVITLETSISMSLVSMVFGSLLWGIAFSDFLDILLIVISTMTLGLVLSLFTIAVSFVTFKKGLDPDVIEYPIMSTVADIFITICYVFTINLYFLSKYVVAVIGLAHVILSFYILSKDLHESEFVKTIKEALFTLFFASFIVNVTGTFLHRINIVVTGRKEVYTVYPALIDLVGDVGSVVGCTATTKLALGLLKPSLTALRSHAAQIFAAWAASIIMFVFLSISSLLINGMLALSTFISFTSILLIANIMAVAAIIFVAYGVSILTFQKGLDPDNFVIPIESSLADSLTSAALLVSLFLLG